jgi:hypothetical protein
MVRFMGAARPGGAARGDLTQPSVSVSHEAHRDAFPETFGQPGVAPSVFIRKARCYAESAKQSTWWMAAG